MGKNAFLPLTQKGNCNAPNMAHILKNDLLEVHIDLPYENYNFSRFDWTGQISKVAYKGQSLTGVESVDEEDLGKEGKGLFNEFGIDQPIGFKETEIGDWFIKIGIGWLRKTNEVYQFDKTYHIQPANFEVEGSEENLFLTCDCPPINGYAFYLKKEIKLLDGSFRIGYSLKNTGKKPLITNEYTHNFMQFDQASVDQDYALKLPFQINQKAFEAGINPEKVLYKNDQGLGFQTTPSSVFFFDHLAGQNPVDAKWALEHADKKIGLSETGCFQTSKVNLWGTDQLISPELFFDINLKAGEQVKWVREYQIYELGVK